MDVTKTKKRQLDTKTQLKQKFFLESFHIVWWCWRWPTSCGSGTSNLVSDGARTTMTVWSFISGSRRRSWYVTYANVGEVKEPQWNFWKLAYNCIDHTKTAEVHIFTNTTWWPRLSTFPLKHICTKKPTYSPPNQPSCPLSLYQDGTSPHPTTSYQQYSISAHLKPFPFIKPTLLSRLLRQP